MTCFFSLFAFTLSLTLSVLIRGLFSPFDSFCRCAFPWFLAACLPFLSLMSPPILLSLWSFLSSVSALQGGVSVLSQPQLFFHMAHLKLTFFGFLALHFSSGMKVSLFEE